GHREQQLRQVRPEPAPGPAEPPGPAGGGPGGHRPRTGPRASPARHHLVLAVSGLSSVRRGSLMAVREDELVLTMLRTLLFSRPCTEETKDTRAGLPHPTWVR